MIDGGKLTAGKLVIVAVIDLATCRGPRGADDRRREADAGQLGKPVIVSPVPPVVPTIDAGQFQGEADAGQAGHRPGKRRGFPRGRARADDRRRAS